MANLGRQIKRIINTVFPKLRMNRNLRRILSLPLTLDFPYEPELILLRGIIPKDKLFFDIGANEGVYSYVLSQIIGAENIYCFEPLPAESQLLKKRLKNANHFRLALSDTSGNTTIHIPYINGELYETRASLEEDNIENGKNETLKIEVKTEPLDLFVSTNKIKNIGFIKIDVEGHERHVLDGALDVLRQQKPLLMVEIEQRHHTKSITEIIELVENEGYACYFLDLAKLALLPISEYDFVENQDQRKNYHARTYINNFIFIPNANVSSVLASATSLLAYEKDILSGKEKMRRS